MISCCVILLSWLHLFEGQLASQFEAHHHHTSNPEEQDVMTRLQQGARVEHIQVLGLTRDRKHKQTLIMEIHRDIKETTFPKSTEHFKKVQ